jgi:hypothetical protein
VVGVSGTKVANGIAELRLDLSFTLLRNSSSSSVWPYQASKMSKITHTTPLAAFINHLAWYDQFFREKFQEKIQAK